MEIPILKDITVIFAFATFALLICSRLNVPGILGYIVTGLLVGPNGLKLVSHVENVDSMAEIGVVLLLFTIGLEFSLEQLVALKRSAIVGGLLQVVLTVLMFTLTIHIFGAEWGRAVFFGLIFTLSSTAIVLKLLMERGEIESPFGRVTTGILIFQDIAVIPMMLITPMLVPGGSGSILDMFWMLGKAIGVVVFLFVIARFVVPPLLLRVTKTRSREIFLFSIILICMLVAVVTSKAGLSLALGAFLAGMVVSETGYGYQALGNVIPFKDVFTGFFFVSVGMLIDVEVFLMEPILIIVMALSVILIKAIVSGAVITMIGYPTETAAKTGFSLAQVGEFSFILAASGSAIGLLSPYEHSQFISMSVLTMVATPFLMIYSGKFAMLLDKLPIPDTLKKGYFHEVTVREKPLKDHIIIIGYGLAGKNIAKAAKNAGIDYIIIEMNPSTVRQEQARGTPIFYGDASQEEILEHAKIEDARAIVISGADHNASRNMVEAIHRLNPSVAIIMRTRFLSNAPTFKALGASDVIVEEVESSVAILSSVLRHYYVPAESIDLMEAEIRNVEVGTLRRKLGRKQSGAFKGVDSDVITIPVDSELKGRTLRDIDVRYRYNINIIAIKTEGVLKISPGAEERLNERDELIVTGKNNDIAIFAAMVASSKPKQD